MTNKTEKCYNEYIFINFDRTDRVKKFSIKYKVSALMIFTIFISNIFLGVINYDNAKTMASDIILKNNENELRNISDYYFDKLISDMEYIVETWADSEVIRTYNKAPNSLKVVKTIPYDFNHVYNQWTGLTQSMHDITWMYYALESDGSIYIAPLDITMPSDYDARTRDWYKGTVGQSGNIYWTEPYLDAGDSGKILQTVSKAVYENGELKGVIGLDIELTKFTEIIQNLSFARSSSIFLINQKNDIIAHNSENISFYEEHFINSLSLISSSVLTEVASDEYIVSWTPLKINGWKLVAVTKTSFRSDLYALGKNIFLIVCITALISLSIAYVGFNNILGHLGNLVQTTKEYSNGKFDVRCVVDTNDEFSTLANSMNDMLDAIRHLLNERDENYIKTVKVLANAIEASDQYTRGHCDRVGLISLKIGKALGLDSESLTQLEFACILHDIGKIAIPERILNKSSALTDSEYSLIKNHPKVGYDIIRDIHFLDKASQIIIQHHERYDGRGYPYGLDHKDLLTESKILTVADAYDAMSSQRVYKTSTMTKEEIIREFERCAGSQFDPKVVQALITLLKSGSIEIPK